MDPNLADVSFWVALGEFYLGAPFVAGALASGNGNILGGMAPAVIILWVIAAVFAYCAFHMAANRLHETGLEGRGTILSVTQTGAWLNNNPVTVLDLSIKVDGHPAYEVRHRETVPQTAIGRLANGATLPIRVNPHKPTDFIVEWEQSLAHPRADDRLHPRRRLPRPPIVSPSNAATHQRPRWPRTQQSPQP